MQPARSLVPASAVGLAAALLGAVVPAQTVGTGIVDDAGPQAGPFQRIASFPVFENVTVDDETVAEIVTATQDGKTLIYTDSELENLGFIDIADPYDPKPAGVVALGGEPTSVGVKGPYALACINTSADFVDTSGDLVVVDIETQAIVRTLPSGASRTRSRSARTASTPRSASRTSATRTSAPASRRSSPPGSWSSWTSQGPSRTGTRAPST